MDNWKRIICDDTENNNKLALEIWNKDVLVCIVRSKETGIYLSIFEKDIDIPFDWFYKIITEANERII